MECRISQKIDYLRLSELLSKQRQAAERCIAECSPKVRMPGLSVWRVRLLWNFSHSRLPLVLRE